MRSVETSALAPVGHGLSRRTQRGQIRGWLVVYMAGLAAFAVHSLALTVAAIVTYASPRLAGLVSSVPLGDLVFYVVTNVTLVVYAAVLFVLMLKRREEAIIHNLIFNVLSVLSLLSWHFLGEKSLVGTIIDSLPGLVGLGYIATSRRVRATFACPLA